MRRILSIDGGGIRGVFPAAILADIEDQIGASVTDYFDLICGTSTGGIIAVALGMGFTARQIFNLYEELGSEVFRGSRLSSLVRALFTRERYSAIPLATLLERHLGARRLGESRVRLVVPSMSLDTGQVYIWKTAHHPRLSHDYLHPAVEVIKATTAAPGYFKAHVTHDGVSLVDGGTWSNNPTGLAVAEAIGYLRWHRDDLQILSLGCGREAFDLGKSPQRLIGLDWLWLSRPRIVEVFMAGQHWASLGTAAVLTSHEQILRIDPPTPRGRFSLDRVSSIPQLKALATEHARQHTPELIRRFFQQPAEPFVPVYELPPTKA